MFETARRTAALFLISYILLCILGVLLWSGLSRLEDVESVASHASEQSEQTESEVAEIQHQLENLELRVESQ